MESYPDVIIQNQGNKKPINSKKKNPSKTITHVSKGQDFNNIKNSLVSVSMLYFHL